MTGLTYSRLEQCYKSALEDLIVHFTLSKQKSIKASRDEYFLEHLCPPQSSSYNILSGMSGVGKTTIGSMLSTAGYQQLRNVYTRPMRESESEKSGIFIDEATFMNWERDGQFVSTKITNGVWHGLLFEELDRVLKTGALTWTDKSVGSMRKLDPELYRFAQLVYLLPPSFSVLWGRLTAREQAGKGSLTLDEITKRLDEEIEEMKLSCYLPYRYIVNDRPDRVSQILIMS